MRPTVLFGARGLLGQYLAPLFPNALTPTRAEADLADAPSLADYLNRHQPGRIINAAAYTAVDKAESEPAAAFRLNAEAPEEMARWCRQEGARLIHVSTDYVFDGQGKRPWQPDDATAPLNLYGRSKQAGEAAILASNADSLIIRTSWLYDAWRPSFFSTMLKLAETHPELRVVADCFGAPTYTPHLASAIAALSAGGKGIHHVAHAGETSWYGFAEAIFAGAVQCGLVAHAPRLVAVPLADYPSPAQRPRNSRLDCTWAAALGVSLPHWQDGLAEALAARSAR